MYAIKPSAEAPIVTGQIEAEDVATIRASLAKLLGYRNLPEKTVIMDKADVDDEGDEAWQYVRTMLSDVDLRGAVLLDANLKGVDFWRANLKGVVIEANALHAALECRSK